MTIICVKDGVIAADGSSWQGGVMTRTDARKIVRSADGALGASCGLTSATSVFCQWFAGTDSPEARRFAKAKDDPLVQGEDSGFSAVWIEHVGETWFMDFDGKAYSVGPGPQAIGAAWQMALGAMLAGASAESAVRICTSCHIHTGGEVFVERLTPVEAPEDIDARPAETFGADWVSESVNERRAAMAEWRERMGFA